MICRIIRIICIIGIKSDYLGTHGKDNGIQTYRATLDIDIGVKVPDWEKFNKLKKGLCADSLD